MAPLNGGKATVSPVAASRRAPLRFPPAVPGTNRAGRARCRPAVARPLSSRSASALLVSSDSSSAGDSDSGAASSVLSFEARLPRHGAAVKVARAVRGLSDVCRDRAQDAKLFDELAVGEADVTVDNARRLVDECARREQARAEAESQMLLQLKTVSDGELGELMAASVARTVDACKRLRLATWAQLPTPDASLCVATDGGSVSLSVPTANAYRSAARLAAYGEAPRRTRRQRKAKRTAAAPVPDLPADGASDAPDRLPAAVAPPRGERPETTTPRARRQQEGGKARSPSVTFDSDAMAAFAGAPSPPRPTGRAYAAMLGYVTRARAMLGQSVRALGGVLAGIRAPMEPVIVRPRDVLVSSDESLADDDMASSETEHRMVDELGLSEFSRVDAEHRAWLAEDSKVREAREASAARRIQRGFRQAQAKARIREQWRRENAAAKRIQNLARDFLHREQRMGTVRLLELGRKYKTHIIGRWLFRMYLKRSLENARRLEREQARQWHEWHQAQVTLSQRHEDALRRHAHRSKPLAEHLRQWLAAKVLQSVVRVWYAKRSVRLRREAIVCIQAIIRGVLARRRFVWTTKFGMLRKEREKKVAWEHSVARGRAQFLVERELVFRHIVLEKARLHATQQYDEEEEHLRQSFARWYRRTKAACLNAELSNDWLVSYEMSGEADVFSYEPVYRHLATGKETHEHPHWEMLESRVLTSRLQAEAGFDILQQLVAKYQDVLRGARRENLQEMMPRMQRRREFIMTRLHPIHEVPAATAMNARPAAVSIDEINMAQESLAEADRRRERERRVARMREMDELEARVAAEREAEEKRRRDAAKAELDSRHAMASSRRRSVVAGMGMAAVSPVAPPSARRIQFADVVEVDEAEEADGAEEADEDEDEDEDEYGADEFDEA